MTHCVIIFWTASDNLFSVAHSLAIFILVSLSAEDLDTTIASLLWSHNRTGQECRRRGIQALRYFRYKWSIGYGDDSDVIRERLQSHIWKPYRTYLSSESEEVLETIIDDNLPDLFDADVDAHWRFVASSKIFEEYVDRVRDAAIPTFFSQAKRLVEEGVVGGENANVEASKLKLLRALAELQWCFMQTGTAPTVHLSSSDPSLKSFRVLNLFKLAVEASSHSVWQWWPLQPPSARGKAGDTECRMSWKCVSPFAAWVFPARDREPDNSRLIQAASIFGFPS